MAGGDRSERTTDYRPLANVPCPACPCPEICLGWAAFCAWAAEVPRDAVKLRHIRARSEAGDRAPADAGPTDIQGAPSPASATPHPGTPGLSEAIALVRGMRACPFRSTGPGCGCAGARCSLRLGAPVSHIDCIDCQRRYPER